MDGLCFISMAFFTIEILCVDDIDRLESQIGSRSACTVLDRTPVFNGLPGVLRERDGRARQPVHVEHLQSIFVGARAPEDEGKQMRPQSMA